jgi:hypothetical protein
MVPEQEVRGSSEIKSRSDLASLLHLQKAMMKENLSSFDVCLSGFVPQSAKLTVAQDVS